MITQKSMQDLYYIIITILFGLFVIFMAFLGWRALMKPEPVENNEPENEREIIYAFCNQRKAQSIAEKEKGWTEQS